MAYFGTADYYSRHQADLVTPLFQCERCGTFRRQVDDIQLHGHFDAASYTNPEFENRLYEMRVGFFKQLIALATNCAGHVPRTCLDYGCSYGHLLLLLRQLNSEVCGIEACEQTLKICRHHNLNVYRSVDELDENARFELITLVDSLYYLPSPRNVLNQLHRKLTSDGVLLVRVVNRNWILRFLKTTLRKKHFGGWLGDAIVGYNQSSLATLLRGTGYRIVSTHYAEPGKRHLDWSTKLLYLLGTSISYGHFGPATMSPGITMLAKKQ